MLFLAALFAWAAAQAVLLAAVPLRPSLGRHFAVWIGVGTLVLLPAVVLLLTRLVGPFLRRLGPGWGAACLAAWLLVARFSAGGAPGPVAQWYYAPPEGAAVEVAAGRVSEWGHTRRAIWMHARDGGRSDLRWRWRMPLDAVTGACGGRAQFQLTQPAATVFDAQGMPRADADGVTLVFKGEGIQEGATLATVRLVPARDPAQRGWNAIDLAIPADTTAVVLEIEPNGGAAHDTVALHTADLTTAGVVRPRSLRRMLWFFMLAVVVSLAYAGSAASPAGSIEDTVARVPQTAKVRRKGGVLGTWGAGLAFFGLGVTGVLAYAHAERTFIPYWDFSGYWLAALGLKRTLASSWAAGLAAVGDSLGSDYSLLPALPVTAVMGLLGEARWSFLLALVCMFALPTWGALTAALRDTRVLPRGTPTAAWVAAAILLLLPTFFMPLLRGYADAGGVGLALLVIWLYFRGPRPTGGALLVCAAALTLMPLYRRWYAFWVVAFLVCAGLDAAIRCVAMRREGWRAALGRWQPVVVLGLGTALGVLMLAPTFVEHVIGTDYSAAYAAYRRTDMAGAAGRLLQQVGWLYAALAATGAVVLLLQRSTRRLALFLICQGVIIFVQFNRVQTMSSHHLYLFVPALTLFLGLGFLSAWTARRRAWQRGVLAAVALCVGLAVTGLTTWPRWAPVATQVAQWLPSERLYARQRRDLAELTRLLTALSNEVASGARGIYVVSSSAILNEDILRNAVLDPPALPFKSTAQVVPSAHVDARDGFPATLLRADLVVVPTPVQTHLRPEFQRVVTLPAVSFLQGRDIGAAYTRCAGPFALDDGVQAFVYRKQRAPTVAERAALNARFEVAYPDDQRLRVR